MSYVKESNNKKRAYRIHDLKKKTTHRGGIECNVTHRQFGEA